MSYICRVHVLIYLLCPFNTQWIFEGYSWQVFYSQTFAVSGTPLTVPGIDILHSTLSLYDVSSWGLFGATIGYVFFFRAIQWFLLTLQTGGFDSFVQWFTGKRYLPAPVTEIKSSFYISPRNRDLNS